MWKVNSRALYTHPEISFFYTAIDCRCELHQSHIFAQFLIQPSVTFAPLHLGFHLDASKYRLSSRIKISRPPARAKVLEFCRLYVLGILVLHIIIISMPHVSPIRYLCTARAIYHILCGISRVPTAHQSSIYLTLLHILGVRAAHILSFREPHYTHWGAFRACAVW